MSCFGNHEWTVRYPGAVGRGKDPEFRPNEMTLQEQRGKLDHCRLRFDTAVGEQLKRHTRYEDGQLSDLQPVDLVLNGEPYKRMLSKPDGYTYGSLFTHVELYDYQHALDSGEVDKQWGEVKLKTAYQYAFDQREDNGVFQGLRFPDELEDLTGVGEGFKEAVSPHAEKTRNRYDQASIKVVEGEYAADFNDVTVLEAIWQLNETYGLYTWTDPDGYLVVGSPEATGNYHVAAPDDNRVWRYSKANIAHPREPLQKVVVHGAWVDQPGFNAENQWREWFNPTALKPGGKPAFGSGDLHATGVAERTDLSYGQTVVMESTGAKKNSVEDVARLAFFEELQSQNTGSVTIDTTNGGEFTPYRSLRIGDFIHLVPDDKRFESPYHPNTGEIGDDPADLDTQFCGSVINNELYVVRSVTHNVTGSGHWTIDLDVGLWPYDVQNDIETHFMYYEPNSEKYLTTEEATKNLSNSKTLWESDFEDDDDEDIF